MRNEPRALDDARRMAGAASIRWRLIAGLVCAAHCPTVAAAAPTLSLDGRPQLGGLLYDLPVAASTAALLDQVLPSAVYLLDESGGFSELDVPKFSLNGDSWVWNRWYVEGLDLSDPVFAGAPAVRLPLRSLQAVSVHDPAFAFDAAKRGLELFLNLPEPAEGRLVGGSYQIGRVGDIVPPAHALMDWTSGSHSRDRAARPTSLRRHLVHPYQVYGLAAQFGERAVIGEAVSLQSATRRFVDFDAVNDQTALDSPALGYFSESALHLAGAVVVAPKNRPVELLLLTDYLTREHLGAEVYRARQETAALESFAIAPILTVGDVQLGLLLKTYDINMVDPNFSKDFADPDGQELEPWSPGGRYLATALSANYRQRYFYASAYQSLVGFRPDVAQRTHPLTYLGVPYGRYEWHSEPALQAIGDIRLGTSSTLAARRAVFGYNAYLAALYALNDGGANQLGFADLGASFRFDFPREGRVQPFLMLAKTPIALDPDLAWAVHPNYNNGELWLDRGVLIDTPGGAHVRLEGQLRPANAYAWGIGFDRRFSEVWSYMLQGLLKAYHNTYELAFDGIPSDYGYVVADVFYLADGAKDYVLSNRRSSPVYYGLQMQILGEATTRYFFSWSFAAYNAIGQSPFGNGPTANDIGVVSYSSANPNSKRKGNANLDADRAFNTKILAGSKIYGGLWWYSALTHFDGTPFAPYDVHADNGQLARTYNEFRGSPYTFVGPLKGRREDYRLNLDLKLQYTLVMKRASLKTWWAMYNLLDFGNEISELQSLAGRAGRLALEQEIPRAFEFGLEIFDW